MLRFLLLSLGWLVCQQYLPDRALMLHACVCALPRWALFPGPNISEIYGHPLKYLKYLYQG